jgi:cytochrome c-type biogenesis protein CcmH
MPSRLSTWLVAAALTGAPALILSGSARADDHQHGEVAAADVANFQEYVEGASRLEGRIMAPCCWQGTIDSHGSPISNELRIEIRKRLKAGESPDAIEASFVQRYGPKVIAVPDSFPIARIATLLFLGFGVAGYGAYRMLGRWSKAGAGSAAAGGKGKAEDETAPSGGEPKRDALDERLDRELAEIENQA